MADCKYCHEYIVWERDDESDRWVPCDEDGARHDCRPARPPRETPAAAYDRGYKEGNVDGFERGFAEGRRTAPVTSKPTLAELFPGLSATDLIRLTHPDLHPKEKAALANRITARLLELR